MRNPDNRWFFGFLLAVGTVLFFALSIGLRKGTDWWAAWGQWIGGIGSIAAAVAAVWVAVEGWRKSDRQAAEQAKRLEDAQTKEQAARFGVWIDLGPDNQYEVQYQNANFVPVYDAELRISVDGGNFGVIMMMGTCAPTTSPMMLQGATRVLHEQIAAAVKANFPDHYQTVLNTHDVPKLANPSADFFVKDFYERLAPGALVSVSFRDSNGRDWRRLPNGLLEEMTPDHQDWLTYRSSDE